MKTIIDPAVAAKAARLLEAREAAGFDFATDAAKALGIRYPTYAAHENGTRDFDIPSAIRYAEAFRISPSALVFGCGEIPQNRDFAEIMEYVEEIRDLLHALDKIGDGIGGADGFAVSAVALNAKSIADNVIDALRAMGAKS
ncbi:helix-turn-helix transcriptional regulator [Agrobacterium sp. SUL3]|uniref:helix-turn-helix domain-containing protein n=1 Tax=Agrobacterium sp. SUL3 TaxID=1701910 RepID=UPI00069A5B8E|nr:helix-turn-helix transcriptional regulator [Agrobacterium sp. SUL3]KNY35572.1 hypothetical protein AKG12_00585 [Agrobacterium sp. SUL3]